MVDSYNTMAMAKMNAGEFAHEHTVDYYSYELLEDLAESDRG